MLRALRGLVEGAGPPAQLIAQGDLLTPLLAAFAKSELGLLVHATSLPVSALLSRQRTRRSRPASRNAAVAA